MSTPVTPTTPTSITSTGVATGPRLTLLRRQTLRSLNWAALLHRPDLEAVNGLDSSLKRNTAFVKKLRTITADNSASLLTEFEGLKLSKFLEEAISVLLENKPRSPGDWAAFIELLSVFHQRYETFTGRFIMVVDSEITMLFSNDPGSAIGVIEERNIWLSRARQLLRLQGELFLVGISIPDDNEPTRLLTSLQRFLPIDDEVIGSFRLPLATSFIRSLGSFFLPRMGDGSESGEQGILLVSEAWQQQFATLIIDYFRAQCRYLVRTQQKLITLKRRSRYHYEHRGDLTIQQTFQLQEVLQLVERLYGNLQVLAKVLHLPLPTIDEAEGELEMGEDRRIVFADPTLIARLPQLKSLIYDSEEEQSFYEDLVNLAEMVPEALFSRPATPADGTGTLSPTSSTSFLNNFTRQDELGELELLDVEPIDPEQHNVSVNFSASPSSLPSSPSLLMSKEEDNSRDLHQVKAFFEERLPNLRSRTLVDQAAIAYCYIHNKTIQRRLIETLLELPYRRLDLLPFLARLVATLRPLFPEIPEGLISSLVGQFTFLFHRPTVPLVGTRARIGRYLAELIRFGVITQGTAYALLRRLVVDGLTGSNVDMVALLLEGAGRFLLHQPESHRRLVNLFEIIRKKQRQAMMTVTQVALLDNALYLCDPTSAPSIPISPARPPLQLYLRYLVRNAHDNEVEDGTDVKVPLAEQLLCFPWDEEEWQNELRAVLGRPWKVSGREGALENLAKLVLTISLYEPVWCMTLIDGIIEDLRYYLLANRIQFNHCLMAIVRYLGELNRLGLVKQETLWWILQFLLWFGSDGKHLSNATIIDPPTGDLRIRLLCALLSVIDPMMMEGDRVNLFWLLFQYYLSTRRELSREVEFLLDDTARRWGRQLERLSPEAAIEKLVSYYGPQWNVLRQQDHLPEGTEKEEDEGIEDERAINTINTSTLTLHRDELEQAIRGMVTAGLEERRLERRVGIFDSPIPLSVASPARKLLNKPEDGLNDGNLYGTKVAAAPLRLLLKKKNKVVMKELNLHSLEDTI